MPADGSRTINVTGVHDTANAAAALFEFTWYPHSTANLTVRANGNPAISVPWPYGNTPASKSFTLAVPIPLTQIHDGTNTFVVATTDTGFGGASIANIDLILAGAGSGEPPPTAQPAATSTAQPTSTPTATATAQPSDTPTPTATATSVPTDTPTAVPTDTATPGPTVTDTPTPIPTDTPVPPACAIAVLISGTPTTVTRPVDFCTNQ